MNSESWASDTQEGDSIHGIFDAVARECPEKVALDEDGRTWSYRQVADSSESVAAQLSARGVCPGEAVGILMNRSAQQVVAMLGVLKAGAHYVPLSPDQPDHRIALMADQADVRLILTDTPEGRGTARALGAQAVELDIRHPAQPFGGDGTRRSASSVAYIMFTSGSTGVPKGVAVTHRNVVGLVKGQSYVAFEPTSVFLHLSNPSFDGATFEVWGALLAGARVVIARPGPLALDELERLLLRGGVTTAFLTTALFHEVIDLRPQTLARLDWLLVGGERMSPSRAARGVELLGPRFIHVYGPTEGTTFSTFYPVAEMTPDMPNVPIGRALARRRVTVVDEHFDECPVGKSGEIVVIGEGVALGYINSQGVDSGSFSRSPFEEDCGAPMYRTGDIGRRLGDGVIDFLGRDDDQVKIRGFRIELGEIQTALDSHPDVRHSTVISVDRDNAASLIVAFIVMRNSHEPEMAEISAHLRSRLPEYMLPAHLHILESFPLNANGKIDRAELNQLAARSGFAERPLADLGSGIQGDFESLWRAVLGLPADTELEEDDDFFALGGDSLLVLRLVIRAQESGLDLGVIDVFTSPSWGALNELVHHRGRSHDGGSPIDIPDDAEPSRHSDTERSYPATQMQLGMIYDAEAIGDGSLYHDGISVPVEVPLAESALNDAIRLIASRHEVLRTRFDLSGQGAVLQVVERVPRVPVTVSDATGLSAQAQRAHVEERLLELMRPFDVEVAPLLRVHAVRLGDRSFQLLFAFHHAIMDGWSESVMLSEFAAAYPALLSGGVPALPPESAVPYRQLSVLEGRALADPAVSGFWRDFVDGVSPSLICPMAAGFEPTAGRLTHRVELDPLLCAQLAGAARVSGTSLKSVLLAGHLAVLAEELHDSEVVTGVVVNGRPELPGADRMIGLFLNVLPIAVHVGRLNWRQLIRAAMDAERLILPHRWYPYPQIYRDAGRELFDTVFNYVNFHLYAESPDADVVGFSDQRVLAKSSVALMVDIAQLPGSELLTFEFSVDPARLTQDQLQSFADRYSSMYESLAMSFASEASD